MSLIEYKKIAFISQPEYFRFIYEHDLDNLAEVREFKFTFSMQADQLEKLLEFNADINFFFRGEFVPQEVLQKLSGLKVNLSSEPFPREIDGRIEYSGDSLGRYQTFQVIREKPYDYVFHYDAASLGYMQKDGLTLSGEFAFPVATSVYKPVVVPKDWDVFFIGRSTPHREHYFGPLKHYFNFLHIAHGIWGPDLVRYMNASRICLNVHAENEISWEPRLQMMLACKTFIISEPVTPNSYLRPGVDYIEVKDKDEMFRTVSSYLQHPEEREKIAECGYRRILDVLDSKKVFTQLMEDISMEKYPRYSVHASRMKSQVGEQYKNKIRRFIRKIAG